jgi:hypothetical protein
MSERIKMPLFFKAAFFIYIGGVCLFLSVDENPQQAIIFKALTITIATGFFTYGVVAFIQDVKEGGIAKVYNRFKTFLYGSD